MRNTNKTLTDNEELHHEVSLVVTCEMSVAVPFDCVLRIRNHIKHFCGTNCLISIFNGWPTTVPLIVVFARYAEITDNCAPNTHNISRLS